MPPWPGTLCKEKAACLSANMGTQNSYPVFNGSPNSKAFRTKYGLAAIANTARARQQCMNHLGQDTVAGKRAIAINKGAKNNNCGRIHRDSPRIMAAQ